MQLELHDLAQLQIPVSLGQIQWQLFQGEPILLLVHKVQQVVSWVDFASNLHVHFEHLDGAFGLELAKSHDTLVTVLATAGEALLGGGCQTVELAAVRKLTNAVHI